MFTKIFGTWEWWRWFLIEPPNYRALKRNGATKKTLRIAWDRWLLKEPLTGPWWTKPELTVLSKRLIQKKMDCNYTKEKFYLCPSCGDLNEFQPSKEMPECEACGVNILKVLTKQ